MRFLVFLYKVLAVFFLGLIAGCFIALINSYFPLWFIPVFVLGTILLGYIFLVILIRWLDVDHSVDNSLLVKKSFSSVWLRMIVGIILFIAGVLTPFQLTGNLSDFKDTVKNIPLRLVGKNEGNFRAGTYERVYNRAMGFLKNKKIESIYFYKSHTHMVATADNNSYKVRMAEMNGNHVSFFGSGSNPIQASALFSTDELSFEVFKKVMDEVAQNYTLSDVLYVSITKGIRWNKKDAEGRADHSSYLNIKVLFKDISHRIIYDARTGSLEEEKV